MGIPGQLPPQENVPEPAPVEDPVQMHYEYGVQEAPETHAWSPWEHERPYSYPDQSTSQWEPQSGRGEDEGTFMDLLVGPSTSGYGGEPSAQDVETAEHPATQDPGVITQENRVDDVQQASERRSPNFFSRFSGLHFVRRSRRDNRGKRRDPIYRT